MSETNTLEFAPPPPELGAVDMGPINEVLQLEAALQLPDAVRQPTAEEQDYARSLLTIKAAGAAALRGCATPETSGAVKSLEKDFDSVIVEMLKSDPELYGKVEINRIDEFDVVDGKVVDDNGVPMEEMIEVGVQAAERAAAKDARMTTQVIRDRAERSSAQRKDQMVRGELDCNTIIEVSTDPMEAIERDGAAYWTNGDAGFYYVPGMAFVRMAHFDGEKLITGSFSVDMSDKETWRELMGECGVEIPEGESTDTWLQHAIEATMTKQQAIATVLNMRARYYEMRGSKQQRHSINELIKPLQGQVKQDFQQLYMAMAQAAHLGRKNATVHAFAEGLLKRPSELKPEVLQQLRIIQASEEFDDTSIKMIDQLMRYATVEGVRKHILAKANGQPMPGSNPQYVPKVKGTGGQSMPVEHLIQQRTSQVLEGADAGRSYGACGAGVSVSAKDAASQQSGEQRNPQEAYAGKGKTEERKNWKKKQQPCQVQTCPNSRKVVECGPCGVCMERCQEQYYDKGKDPTKIGLFWALFNA